jgi:hypothetical protein
MAGLLCAIHQPNFLPRRSTFAKLYAADIWIILDDVQFTRRDYQNRCYLTPVADAQFPGRWLTIPVHLPGGRATLIRDVRLAEPALTAKRTSGILRDYYRRAPYRSDILDMIPGTEETITGTGRLADVRRARHDHSAAAAELAGSSLPKQRRPGPRRPFRSAGRPHARRRGSHVPVRRGRQPLPRTGRLRRARTRRNHVHPPEHAADLSPETARRVSVLADLAAEGPERLSAAMREHAQLIRDAGTSAGGRIGVSKQPVSVH